MTRDSHVLNLQQMPLTCVCVLVSMGDGKRRVCVCVCVCPPSTVPYCGASNSSFPATQAQVHIYFFCVYVSVLLQNSAVVCFRFPLSSFRLSFVAVCGHRRTGGGKAASLTNACGWAALCSSRGPRRWVTHVQKIKSMKKVQKRRFR
jgi:hypothetical protein